MTEEQFWEIIARTRELSWDCQSQSDELQKILSTFAAPEILQFDRLFHDKLNAAYRWDLWGAAHLIMQGCTDDSFVYFRCWLIGQGRQAYEKVLADPQAILDLLKGRERNIECETLRYASICAYEAAIGDEGDYMDQIYPPGLFSGVPLPDRSLGADRRKWLSQAAGNPWETETDLAAKFPKIAARFSAS